jgi:uncharacterized protein (TIGR04255 family)
VRLALVSNADLTRCVVASGVRRAHIVGRLLGARAAVRRCALDCAVVAFEFVKQQPVLRNAPLKLVICQMRFPRQIGAGEAEMRPIQRALAHRYPVIQVGQATDLMLTASGVSPRGEPEPVFQFRSEDGGWTVTATRDSASLETTAYLDFQDFAERWEEASTALAETLDLSRQERIGLRYVNELACPPRPAPEQVAALVSESLVGVIGAHPRTRNLLSSMQEMRFAQERGVGALRHGLVLRDDGQAAYVLDLDFYDDQPQPLDLDDQLRLLADFNHGAYELFQWSVHPDLFATFDPEEATDG